MSLIRPFAGLRPLPERAAEVTAPPYDVLNTQEAREQVEGRPWSFLHISKPEIDLAPDISPYDPAVYAKGAENLQHQVNEGVLKQDPQPYYYLYRLIMGSHQQVGLVAAASVPDYDTNRIRKHEFTRPDKEDDRVRQIDALNAQTGPVFLTYKHHPDIDALVAELTQAEPSVDVTAQDGVQHSLWVVDNAEHIETITQTFDAMDNLYIADGHHRSAAASRVAAKRQAENPNHTGDEAYNYFLTVIFPDNQMQILDYNRVVTDLNGLSAAEFLEQVGQCFNVEKVDSAYKPQQAAEFGMYLENQWYKLSIAADSIPNDPVKSLDVSLLADNLIAPILNITDPRRDKRIDFVGGIRGLQELEKRVNSGEMKVAFALFATSLEALMAVADADQVMPPKSTWFEPKLADGLVSHVL
ncbi:DUF1015 family protein [Candidatus Albibeggiatoa sp. nov. NOAA]|uniref:DUF1015 domain-containing protein n=1 Tax=Candidatus Albibeggiatoa sp. nov. NOAA TaxID=3162724 RepID=UPI0032FFC55F|nr:DUF1015 family protein [Thiotrichaceae bacterium]